MRAIADDHVGGLSRGELEILQKVRDEGALLEPELPIKLDRDGDDLRPELENLLRRKLIKVRTAVHHGQTINIYLTARRSAGHPS